MDAGAEFSLKFIKKSTGELVTIKKAVSISSYHKGTRNIQISESKEIRKIHDVSIVELNDKEVFVLVKI